MLDNDKSSWDYSELVELYNKNQFKEVIEKINTFDNLSEDTTEIYNLLGASYLALNNYEEANNCYAKVLSVDPNNYDALLKLGLIDVSESNFVDAKKIFKQLIKINNKRYEAHLNLSNIIGLEGDIDKANHVLKNFLENIEENIEIINSIGINLLNTRKYKELEKHINKFINKFESYILYFLKGYLLTKNGQIKKKYGGSKSSRFS